MENERDDFWDLKRLLPAKKKSAPPPPFPIVTVPVESGKAPPEDPERRLSLSPTTPAKEEMDTYTPEDNPLLLSVCIIRRPSVFLSYHRFRLQAQRYFSEKGAPCDAVPFFSYVPQYEHMTEEQKRYYFYWRSSVREGRFLDCDIAYLYLYFFEIINLPDLIAPKEGARLLAYAFVAYSEKYPKILPYMAVWLSDYCLVHGVPCPHDILQPILPSILAVCGMKEFYLGSSRDLSRCHVEALLSLGSDYHWQSSRYAKDGYLPLFEAHIPAAARLVLEKLLRDGTVQMPYSKTVKRYDAFCGAVCASELRCALEITYYSVSHTEQLRRILTSSVKYAENRLRIHLAIKSRLSVAELPQDYRDVIDAYFERALPKKTVAQSIPEYEKQYEAIGTAVNLADALQIEEASWDNTRLLVSESEEEILSDEEAVHCEPLAYADGESTEDAKEESLPLMEKKTEAMYASFLESIMNGNIARQKSVCEELQESCESIAAKINELFYDLIGDIVLEFGGSGYTLVADYLEEATEWIAKNGEK